MLSREERLFEELRVILFAFLAGLVLLRGLIYTLLKPVDKYSFTPGLLILSSGFGNLLNGAVNDGRVVDFMLVQLDPFKTAAFNADE